MSHRAMVYRTREEYLAAHVASARGQRRAIRRWKSHVARNGNVPLIHKCSICSGANIRMDIKHGSWKPARPTKAERDEVNVRRFR
jgi:hypothetical protein